MQPTRYSILFLFHCFLFPSCVLLAYVFLCHKPSNIPQSDPPARSFSFTAYIPLSSRSAQSLNILLEPFTSIPSSHLKQLVFICPEHLVSQFRLDISRVIAQESQYHPDVQLSFDIRPTSSSDYPAELLQQASEASTDWVLILDEGGIDDINEVSLQALYRGSYFVPTSPGLYDFTAPFYQNDSAPRVPISHWQDPNTLRPPLFLPTSSLKAYTQHQDSIVFLFPTFNLLRSSSKIICGLLARHHTLRLFVYDQRHLFSGTQTSQQILDLCPGRLQVYQTIKISEHGTQLPLLSWLIQSPPKVLFSVQEDRAVLEALLFTNNKVNITRIYIPANQYPYTDWIASLSISELQKWHVPRFTFSVITQNRPKSLHRLLTSLSSALYFGDTDLHIRINIDSSADPETKHLAQTFLWSHGSFQIHQRIIHGGLLPAIVESWYPRNNDSYGLLLEDDVELSPLFYAWIKMTVLKYRYGTKCNTSHNLFGISLYQQKHLELPPEGRRPFSARTLFSSHSTYYIPTNSPYLSSIPCSWGAIYFPEHWREFHDYLPHRLAPIINNDDDIMEPIVPNVRSNRWSRSWKKYFIELVYLRGYVMLYPNYADFVSLSTNHLEPGSHVRGKISFEKRGLFALPLMRLPSQSSAMLLDDSNNGVSESLATVSTGLLDLPMERLPQFEDLPVLNLTGSLTSLGSLIAVGEAREKHLNGF